MIVYAQTQRKEPAIGADRWKIIHTVELPRDKFIHFKDNLLENYDFITTHADEMYVDRDGVIRGMLVLCADAEDGILVNSEGSSYARYSAFLPGARTYLTMDRHPSLRDFCAQMSRLTEKFAMQMVGRQEDGRVQLSYQDFLFAQPPEGFSVPFFLDMLAKCPEISGIEETGSEIIVTIAEPYLWQDKPEQSAEQSM